MLLNYLGTVYHKTKQSIGIWRKRLMIAGLLSTFFAVVNASQVGTVYWETKQSIMDMGQAGDYCLELSLLAVVHAAELPGYGVPANQAIHDQHGPGG